MRIITSICLTLAVAAPLFAASKVTSEACYSCHAQQALTPIEMHGNHPVEVDYRQRVAAEGRLRPPSAQSGFGSTVSADLLVEGRVACTSCHATHEQESVMPFRLLARPNAQVRDGADATREYTALCIACHDMSR